MLTKENKAKIFSHFYLIITSGLYLILYMVTTFLSEEYRYKPDGLYAFFITLSALVQLGFSLWYVQKKEIDIVYLLHGTALIFTGWLIYITTDKFIADPGILKSLNNIIPNITSAVGAGLIAATPLIKSNKNNEQSTTMHSANLYHDIAELNIKIEGGSIEIKSNAIDINLKGKKFAIDLANAKLTEHGSASSANHRRN